MDIIDGYAKYLVDFAELEAWFQVPKNPVYMDMAARFKNILANEDSSEYALLKSDSPMPESHQNPRTDYIESS